jgi:DNA-dependent RNA polymerase auxiliary subunit epsilon
MERHETRIDDETLFIEVGQESLEIGAISDICAIVGGDTYSIEYDERQQATAWLSTDEDGTITFDVRDTLAEMDYNDAFVEKIEDQPLDETTEDGHPVRTEKFAELMQAIWDSKGTIELDDE